MGQVLGLLLRGEPGEGADGRRAARAALIEHEHAVVLERALEPARSARMALRPCCLVSGAALKEDEEWPVGAVWVRDLAGKDRDAPAVWLRVIERNLELVLGQDQATRANDNGHAADYDDA